MATSSFIKVLSSVCLFLLITGLAGQVEYAEFTNQFKSKRGIGAGAFCQFVILPFVGFCSVSIFGLTEVVGLSLIVVSSSPGGSFSNWWCSIFNADLALSVAMTTISTVGALVFLPMNIVMYGTAAYSSSLELDGTFWVSLATTLGVVVIAVASGLFISARIPTYRQRAFRIGNVAGIGLVLLGLRFSSSNDRPIWERDTNFYLGVMTPPLTGIVLSLAFASSLRLERPQCIAVAIETCYQNTGIALAIALANYDDDNELADATGVPVLYQVVQLISLLIFSLCAWKMGWTYAPINISLREFCWNNYQRTNLDPESLADNFEGIVGIEEDGATHVPAIQVAPMRKTNELKIPGSPSSPVCKDKDDELRSQPFNSGLCDSPTPAM